MAHNSARQHQIPHDLERLLPRAREFFERAGPRRTATFKDFRTTLNIGIEVANGLVHTLLAEGYILRGGAQGYRRTPPLRLVDDPEVPAPVTAPEIPYLSGSFGYQVCEALIAFPEGLDATAIADLSVGRSRYVSVCALLRELYAQGYLVLKSSGRPNIWAWTRSTPEATQERNRRELQAARAVAIERFEQQLRALHEDLDVLYARTAAKVQHMEVIRRKLERLID